jgi:hypothetical protein
MSTYIYYRLTQYTLGIQCIPSSSESQVLSKYSGLGRWLAAHASGNDWSSWSGIYVCGNLKRNLISRSSVKKETNSSCH